MIRGTDPGRYYTGVSVAGAGDVNGDGIPDLVIELSSGSCGRPNHTYVVFGNPAGGPIDLAEVGKGRGGFVVRGAGDTVAGTGDVNGDGLADLLIGAPRSGAAYVVFGLPGLGEALFRRGDVNGDGDVDISDGIRLLLHLFGGAPGPGCLDAADADDSGKLELADAIFNFLYLFSPGPAPPPPGSSDWGWDPTDDELGCARPRAGCPQESLSSAFLAAGHSLG